MDLFEAVIKRATYRGAYKQTEVPREDLDKMVQAAIDAPSGCNAQSTYFVIIDDKNIMSELRITSYNVCYTKLLRPPLYNINSKILILGSFPSVKSREAEFFYGHPQNRFWKVLSGVFETDTPNTIEQKRKFLLSHGVAVWDVIASCEITGSADSSIKNVKANNLTDILGGSDIKIV